MRGGKGFITKALSVGLLTTACAAGMASAAPAQVAYQATVTAVPSGDTVTARLSDGREIAVRLIGIDAPAPTECGGGQAADALADAALGHAVELETDPAVELVDVYGRMWTYVDRADGVDVGLELIHAGWATAVDDGDFARLPVYLDAQDAADGGVWQTCGGDFHLTRAEQRRATLGSAKAFVRRYYRHVSADRFASAWRMLGQPVKRRLGGRFRVWRSGYRGSLGVRVTASRARLSGRRALVRVRLSSRDRDICSGRVVRQRFRGSVTLADRGDSWRIVAFRIAKVGGGTPRLSKAQCPAPEPKSPPASPPPRVDCQGYDPCLGPGPDYDCAGGSGNGPRYVDGPVYVNGGDPYDLDSDGDGVGCET